MTAVAATDIQDGWREHRLEGGVVCDVQSGEIVAHGLSMPHSPRWHQDRLWLLESGADYLGYVDLASGRFERVAFCLGLTRGLAFTDDYAIVGMSNGLTTRRLVAYRWTIICNARGSALAVGLL